MEPDFAQVREGFFAASYVTRQEVAATNEQTNQLDSQLDLS
jgi:hypothetical protein